MERGISLPTSPPDCAPRFHSHRSSYLSPEHSRKKAGLPMLRKFHSSTTLSSILKQSKREQPFKSREFKIFQEIEDKVSSPDDDSGSEDELLLVEETSPGKHKSNITRRRTFIRSLPLNFFAPSNNTAISEEHPP